MDDRSRGPRVRPHRRGHRTRTWELTLPTPDDDTSTRRRARVALLECDHTDADLRGIDGDYADMHLRLLGPSNDLELRRVDVVAGAALPDLAEVDALLVTGSRHDAVATVPWTLALAELLRAAHDRDVPVVGICFGHQLIAHALGGRVERAQGGWGVGVHEATLTAPAAGSDPSARFSLIYSHQDQVVDLPPDGKVIATSAHAPIVALQVGSLLGIQGHPEFTPAYARALLEQRADRIPATVRARASDSLRRPTDHEGVGRWITDHLLGATA